MKEKVYKIVSEIPRGKVLSYKRIGELIGSRGYRAIGKILNKSNGLNCHRVVKENGEVGGFNRGVNEKIKLLKKEGVKVVDGKVSKDCFWK